MRVELELQLAEGIEAEMAKGENAGCAIMVIARMLDEGVIKSWKPPMATLAKWDRRGWWNFGVSLRSGWFEPGGLASVYDSITRRAQSMMPKKRNPDDAKLYSERSSEKALTLPAVDPE